LARGDLAAAEATMEEYEARPKTERGGRFSPRESFWLKGHLALRRGRAAEAVENFSAAVRHRPLMWNLDSFEDCLADAYLKLGRLDEAAAEYERVLRLNPNYPLARYRLAQAHERAGRLEQARAAYEQFLQTWRDADADLPEMTDALSRLRARDASAPLTAALR
jgi:tetratricopeptide (TPR) repeat protein